MGLACTACSALYVIGGLVVLRVLFEIVGFIYLHFLRPAANLKKYGANSDKSAPRAWAIVTGATDGIGKGFAKVLAKRGFNIVLVSRTQAKLDQVADELKAASSVEVKTVAADCGDCSDNNLRLIEQAVSACEVGVLVNNVGVNTAYPTSFADHSMKEIDSIIDVNVRFHTRLTKVLLPILARRRSLIIHLSSFSGAYPAALMPIYSASKAYDDAFSRALAPELKRQGIDSVSVVPHYVVSAMSGFSRPKWDVPTPEAFAAATLAKVDAGLRIIPHWAHDLMARVIDLLPVSFVAEKTYGMMKTAREKLKARAQRLKEKENKAN